MRETKSIIYLNFAPYENAGRILDFLVETFPLVVLFSFNFHKLNNKSQSNYIRIYRDGKKAKQIKLFKLPTPEALLFITLPLIMILIAIQTIWHLVRLKMHYGRFDLYLTVNAFTAWIGNILRSFRIVSKTIFWVWDYYPPGYPDWRIRIARWGYWQFDRWSSRTSSSVIFLNKRLVELRQNIGVLPKDKSYSIVPIGTNPGRIRKTKQPIIGHLGVLKQSQGLDLVFDTLDTLTKEIPTLNVEIIGSGPDEAHFKARAKQFRNVRFFGFVSKEDKVDDIIRAWKVGIATYIPDKSSPAYWTDPSKIKAYLGQGVPVITTAIAPFSKEIKRFEAGAVVNYHKPREFIEAVKMLCRNQDKFKDNVYQLAKKYYYKDLYPKLFKELQ